MSFFLFAGKKPLEITVPTTEGPHLYTPGIIPSRPYSTPTTDITDEITEKESFKKPHTVRHTPDLYLHNSRDNNEGDKEDSDPMLPIRVREQNGISKARSELLLTPKTRGTQTANLRRNVGTMCERAKTSDFGNTIRTPPPETKTSPFKQYDTSPKETSSSQHKSSSTSERHSRVPTLEPPNYAPSSISRSPPQSPPPRTRDSVTTSSSGKNPAYRTNRSTDSSSKSSHSQHPKSNSSLSKHYDDHRTPPRQDDYTVVKGETSVSSSATGRIRSTEKKTYASNYEEKTPRSNESISPKYDHNTTRSEQINFKPIKDDPYYPGKPLSEKSPGKPITVVKSDKEFDDNSIRKLPSGSSTSTLHHAQQQRQTPPTRHSPVLNIGTENFIRQSSINESSTPFETHYVREPNRNFTTNNSSPLKHDDLRSENKRILLLNVINSSRTYVFEKQSSPDKNIHESRSNGNFLLGSPRISPSLNSSVQARNLRAYELTNVSDDDDYDGQHLGSQVI